MRSIYRLKNHIMTYSWGSSTAIADLRGRPAPSDTPEAELWMGAHPKASSEIEANGQWTALNDVIRQDPVGMLGEAVVARFGVRLPYLFKVLAASRPLSIQAHPDKTQAEKGFSRENALSISLEAPHRNYRDDNHKPECICALTPFWALNGFREIEEIIALLQRACPQTLSPDIGQLDKAGTENRLKFIFNGLVTLSWERKAAVLTEALSFAGPREEADPIWKWVVRLAEFYPDDIGVLAPIFLNLICLSPGEAMYLPAGRLHAYLDGTGLELMANSDNVLRGGLTPKHVDVAELLTVLRFEPTSIDPIGPRRISPCEAVYDTPASEFSLSRIRLNRGETCRSDPGLGARIFLCTEGSATLTAATTGEKIGINRGNSVFVTGNVATVTLGGEGVLYVAAAP